MLGTETNLAVGGKKMSGFARLLRVTRGIRRSISWLNETEFPDALCLVQVEGLAAAVDLLTVYENTGGENSPLSCPL